MKLLALASTFPAGDSDPVPAFVRDQLVSMKKARSDLQIAVLAPHDPRSRTRNFTRREGYDEYRFHYFWPFRAEKLAGRGIMPALHANPFNYLLLPFFFLGEFLALLSLTRRLRPDLIYAHWFTPQGIVASLVGLITRTPFVFTTHASDVDVWQKVPFMGRYIVRNVAMRARAFTAVSQRSMRKLERFFSPRQWQELQGRAAIIPMGVTIPSPPPVTANPTSDRTIILFMGRLVEKKGVQYLLSAYATARCNLAASQLIIAGEGPLREQLQHQAERLGLEEDQVKFVGFVSGTAKSELLAQAHIHVTPSIVTESGDAEGLPVSLMEGLAYGKVCIATVESGADEVITSGVDGFLVPQKDVGALSDALLEAISLGSTERIQMTQGALRTAQQFCWDVIAQRYHDFLLAPMRMVESREA